MSLFSAIEPLYALSGFFVGLLVGQTGVGGGSLMTPLLVLLFGIHPVTAVGTDLLFAAATKSAGTLVHGVSRTINWQIVARLSLGSIPATIVTLTALSHFDPNSSAGNRIISVVLGLTLLLTALSLLFRARFLTLIGPVAQRVSPQQTVWLTVFTGGVLGALVTLSSVGAGALGVTVLLMLYPRAPMKVIVGSDIAHAVPLTIVAGMGHWWLGSVDWPLLGSLLSGSVPGVVLGSYFSSRLPDGVTRRLLAVILCIVGGRLVL